MLQVGIEEDQVVGLGRGRSRHHRLRLPLVAAVADYLKPLPAGALPQRHLVGAVGGPVVHQDHLPR